MLNVNDGSVGGSGVVAVVVDTAVVMNGKCIVYSLPPPMCLLLLLPSPLPSTMPPTLHLPHPYNSVQHGFQERDRWESGDQIRARTSCHID